MQFVSATVLPGRAVAFGQPNMCTFKIVTLLSLLLCKLYRDLQLNQTAWEYCVVKLWECQCGTSGMVQHGMGGLKVSSWVWAGVLHLAVVIFALPFLHIPPCSCCRCVPR